MNYSRGKQLVRMCLSSNSPDDTTIDDVCKEEVNRLSSQIPGKEIIEGSHQSADHYFIQTGDGLLFEHLQPIPVTPVKILNYDEPEQDRGLATYQQLTPIKGRDGLEIIRQQDFPSFEENAMPGKRTLKEFEDAPSCAIQSDRDSGVTETINESVDRIIADEQHSAEEREVNSVVEGMIDAVVYSMEEGLSQEVDQENRTVIPTGHAGRPRKGRKRKVAEQTRDIRKRNRLTNKKYTNLKGTPVSPKKFVEELICKSYCNDKLSVNERRQEFDGFWGLASYEAKVLFVANRVQSADVKRRRTKNEEKARNTVRSYFIANQKCCKSCFAKTLGISQFTIDSYITKAEARENVVRDRRLDNGGWNRSDFDKIEEVKNHIRKFPTYKSHYRRQDTSAKYLQPHVTVPLMHDLYKSEVEDPVSLATYKKIFTTHFNLRRKPLKKDTCQKCDSLNAQINGNDERVEELKSMLDRHHEDAQNARNEMKSDFQKCKESNNLSVVTFDMQKTLPLPRIPSNVVFYKRQLWLYNCGIHDVKSNKGFCNTWLEGQAGRGAQEVASCLIQHFKVHLPTTTETLILWSDSCGGQNRNIKMVLLLKSLFNSHPNLKTIKMKFLVPGHTFLPNDDDFGDIECALKHHQRLYTPHDYINIMETCRKQNKFSVTIMKKEDFYSSASLEKQITNRKKDENGQQVSWLKTRELVITRDQPFNIILKRDFVGEGQLINLQKKSNNSGRRGRRKQETGKEEDTLDFDLSLLWPNGKPISTPKLNDIRSLMHLIPRADHGFYRLLVGDPSIEDDIDGFDVEELDFLPEYED